MDTKEENSVVEEQQSQVYEMAHLMCSAANKPESCEDCPCTKDDCFYISKAEVLYEAGFRREEEEDPEMPICGDCLCRVCANDNCTGCNDCKGVVETEDDCVNEFVSYGDD